MILFGVRDAAHLTGIPARTIQRWLATGLLHDYGAGSSYLVDLDELATLAERRPRGRLLTDRTVA